MSSATKSKVASLLREKIDEEALNKDEVMAQHSSTVVRALHDVEGDRKTTDDWDEEKVANFASRLAQLTEKSSN
jgi:hypothetical protein